MTNKPYFITLADLPPSPFDNERLSWYRELFNTFVLTEDDVKLVDNGHVSSKYLEAIKNLEKNNLNVFIRNMYNDPDYFSNKENKEGSNYGYPYELAPREITNEFSSYKNVVGFYMADEPYMKEFSLNKKFANFDSLTKLVDFKNKYYPDLFFHMNMVPSSSYDHYYLNKEDGSMYTYEDFIAYYIDTIIKRIKGGNKSICLDNYPFIYKDYIVPDYLPDLLVLSNATRDYNKTTEDKATFGICVQTFHAACTIDSNISRDITLKEEISFQLNCGIALGARLFEYFCFKSFSQDKEAILDVNDNKRIFDLVKYANEETLHFGDALANYTYQGAFFIRNPNPYFAYKSHYCADKFIRVPDFVKNITSTGDVLCGYFECENKKLIMLVNFSDPIQHRDIKVNVELENLSNIKVTKASKEVNEYHSNNVELDISCGSAVIMEII